MIAKGQAALGKLASQVAAGRFEFALNEQRLAREQRLDGRHFLLTNAAKLTDPEAVEAYFTLQEVERAFREMKDLLKMRPIYHWTDRRVQAQAE